ncbi:unnamed protein product [Boreogadus saida]
MFMNFRRMRRCQRVQLLTMCLVLSLMMVCWEQLDQSLVSHVKSYSYRFLDNRFAFIKDSFTIPQEEALSFSNYRYLLDHQDKCANQDVLLLLFVKTSPENTKRRKAIRSTWGNESYIFQTLGADVKVIFVLGAPGTTLGGSFGTKEAGSSATKSHKAIVQDKLVKEDRLNGDLIQQDFADTFHNLTLKLIQQFHWAHTRCAQARFVMTADDDVFVHMPNLVGYLQEKARKEVKDFWIGRVHRGAPPIRDKDSKYYVPYEMYPWPTYPDYTAGAGYVVSRDVAEKIYQATLKLNATIYIDDVFMGICAHSMGVSPQEHLYFSGEGKAPYHVCIYDQMMTSHGHIEDIYDLWKLATDPLVKQRTSGFLGRMYCTAAKLALLCRPYFFNTYPCKGAFA